VENLNLKKRKIERLNGRTKSQLDLKDRNQDNLEIVAAEQQGGYWRGCAFIYILKCFVQSACKKIIDIMKL
jgi:hypothetical protein